MRQPTHTTNAATRALRLTLAAIHVGVGLAITSSVFSRLSQRPQDRVLAWWARALLRRLAVEVHPNSSVPQLEDRNLILAANHVSWLDIFVIHAVKPVRFVAKSEIKNWPVLGWLTARTGTLFIERERRHHTAQVNQQMLDKLAQGYCVGLFPEGTSTRGDHLRKFHSALFEAAVESTAAVIPVGIRYTDSAGKWTQAASYADNISFAQCLRSILHQPSIRAELHFGAPISTRNKNRRQLTAEAEAAIAALLSLPCPRKQSETSADPLT